MSPEFPPPRIPRTPVTRKPGTIPASVAPIAWPPELRAEVIRLIAEALVRSYQRDHPDPPTD
jgi:hypothetical protein